MKIARIIDVTRFYIIIESISHFLRKHVKSNSYLMNILREINKVFYSLHYNPINKYRWKSNYNRFESIIEQYARETKDFFVLQVGACDGIMDDPIHKWIKKYRWKGILVEPQKKEYERLRMNYRDSENLQFENVAIAENSGPRVLYKVKDENIKSDWQRGIASLLYKPGFEENNMITTEIVECVTFDTLMNYHHVKRIDLLQIDVEGYDFELLKLFDFERIKPQIIRYEHCNLKLSDRSYCKKYLKQKGYKILEMELDTGAVL